MSAQPGTRQLHVLHFNDLYHAGDHAGKTARALRFLLALQPYVERLRPLVTFGGDLLAPSLMSTVTRGKHMMEVLELLGVHVATFGNHDFDFGVDRAVELTKEPVLFDWEGNPQCAKSQWVSTNIEGQDGSPIAKSLRTWLQPCQGVTVGILALSEDWLGDAGLSPTAPTADKWARWSEEAEVGRRTVKELREAGAEIVFCLTHSNVPPTEKLVASLPEVDYFLGGHDHVYHEDKEGRFVIAGFDFDDFCLLTFDVPPAGAGTRPRLACCERVTVPGDRSTAEELRSAKLEGNAARMRSLVEHYEAEVQGVLTQPLGCDLAEELVTRKFYLRTQEAPAGNLFADAILAALRPQGAECCFILSGIISCGPSRTPPGPLKLGDIVGWFPWEGGTCLLEVPGAVLLEALEFGCRFLPRRDGAFPQVSGLRFSVTCDPAATDGARGAPFHRISDVWVGDAPLELERLYKVATTDYIADGGNGFKMLGEAKRLVAPEVAPLIHAAVRAHVAAAAPVLTPPKVEGRIRHLQAFRIYAEPAEIGGPSLEDPKEEELWLPAWSA